MKTAQKFINTFQNQFRENSGGVVRQLMIAYAREAIKADRENVTKHVRLRVYPYDIEEYNVTSVKSSYLNEEHKEGFEVEINMETIINAPEIELL